MAVTVTMPQLGETVTEGTILSWAKQVGDTIAIDEVLVEISTDKVDTEMPSPAAGVIKEILVAEGETVEVGTEIVVIADDGEQLGTMSTEDALARAQDVGLDLGRVGAEAFALWVTGGLGCHGHGRWHDGRYRDSFIRGS